jgi:hypothetical protein
MANIAVATALLGRHDAIFADRFNHASLNDAALLSQAKLRRLPISIWIISKASWRKRRLTQADHD